MVEISKLYKLVSPLSFYALSYYYIFQPQQRKERNWHLSAKRTKEVKTSFDKIYHFRLVNFLDCGAGEGDKNLALGPKTIRGESRTSWKNMKCFIKQGYLKLRNVTIMVLKCKKLFSVMFCSWLLFIHKYYLTSKDH